MNIRNLILVFITAIPSLCDGQDLASFSKVLKQSPGDYSANLGMGVCLRELGRFDSALFYFNRAIGIDPKTPDGYVQRGMLFYKTNDFVKGDEDERKAMQLGPDLSTPYEMLGYSFLERKKYNEALPLYDSAIAKNKGSFQAFLDKATALGNLGRTEEAIVALNQAITLKPDYVTAYYNRAYAYISLEEMDSAMADCNKLLDIDNRNVDGLLLRAGLEDRNGDDSSAIRDCSNAIAIDPNNPKAYNQRAISRFDLQDNTGIISDCNKAIELKPDYYEAYVQRGDAYDNLNDYDKAIADYNKAITLDGSKLIAFRECAASEAHKNDYKAALSYLDKGLKIEPGNSYLLSHKFRLLLVTGDSKGALMALDQCIQFHQDSAMIYYMAKANLYDSLKDKDAACKCAFEALKRGLVDGYDYLNTHPCAEYRQNPRFLADPLFAEAEKENAEGLFFTEITTLTKAIALLPDSSSLYYNRGAAKRKLNNFEGAIEDYSKAIALRPKFIEAMLARGVAKQYLNDGSGALKDYQAAFTADSTCAMAYNNYAIAIEDSNINLAIRFYTKAIHFNRNYTTAYVSRGKLYEKLGDNEAACYDFKKAEALGSFDAKFERRQICK